MSSTSTVIWVAGIASGGAIVAALVAARVASRDLATRRRLDSTDRFVHLFEIAHGRSRPRSEGGVGLAEQVAAVALVAEFANRDKWLRDAAREGLHELARAMEGNEPGANVVRDAALRAHARIQP
jgi:hypothetical protein